MSTNPLDIHLTPEQRERLLELSKQSGRPWSDLLDDALQNLALHQSDVGPRLRTILDNLGRNSPVNSDATLDDVMSEALDVARHQKS